MTAAATSTGLVANQVLTSAKDLTKQSRALRELVTDFLTKVKAA